jgi:hypothetical protein
MRVLHALVFAALACGEGPEATRNAPETPEARESPAPRAWVTENADGSFAVHVDGAPRAQVLDALAEAAGFGIVPGRGAAAPRRLSLHLEEASAEEALGQILAGVPHHVHYERQASGGPVELRRVTVGLLPPPQARGEGRARLGQRLRERRLALAERTPEELALLQIEREERTAERRSLVAHLRDSPIDRDRARAATLMKPETDLDALVDYLFEDPSPDVRERAAESLADAPAGEPALTAAEALIEALADPDAGVVAAAIAALEDVHDTLPDPRIRQAIADRADHPDARVREAADDFARWTSD